MSQDSKGPQRAGLSWPNTLGLTCPPAVAGAVSSSLSDSSLLEESSSGLWALLAKAGDDAQAGEVTVLVFQGTGVSTCTGGTLADAGVMGVPFLGEALV